MKHDTFKHKKLAALRAFHGMDQQTLADKAGLSRPTIQRLETGRTNNPSLETLQAIAEVFGYPAAVFFTDEAIHLQWKAKSHKIERRWLHKPLPLGNLTLPNR